MRTFILAWVIGLLGLIMIAGGIWGVIDLFRQEVRAPLKSYGGAVSMVCGGVAMLGMAQGLRLLLVLIVLAHH
jgi:putative intracellular protease/amidase